MTKRITPTQFMWVRYGQDGKVTRAAGGGYFIKNNNCEETPEYGVGDDFDLIKGKPKTFLWKVEEVKWHHDGTFSNGPTIEEVWERVEKK